MGRSSASWWAQAAQNRLIALVLAMVVFVPLVAAPTDSSLRGLAALAFEGFAVLLFATLLWRVHWDLRRESLLAFFRTGANLPVLLLLGLAVLSCALSPHKAYSAQQTLRLGAGVLLYFVAAYQFRRSEHLAKLTDTLLFVAAGASLLGFAQYGLSSETFATGIFGDHQLFGSFLMLLLPVVAVLALTEKTPNRQLAAQIVAVLTAACLLLAQARSAWIGGAAGLMALAGLTVYTAARRGRLAARKHELILPLMLLVVSAGFFLLISPQTGSILNRAGTLSQMEGERGWQYRLTLWGGAWKMIQAHPFGVGPGLYPYYQQEYTQRGIPIHLTGGRASLGEQAHNFYLQTAAELGLPGLLLFAAILAAFFAAGLRRVGQMEEGVRRSLLIGALAAMTAFVVDAVASPAWQYGQNAMFFWLILGVGVGCLRPQAKQRGVETRPLETRQVTALQARFTRSATVLAALALAALLPTFVFADGGGYVDPVSADLTPKNARIRGGQIIKYTLMVKFSDDSVRDVSLAKGTTFSQVGGKGFMTGKNKRYYQSRFRENDVPTITGKYTQGVKTVSDSTTLTVVP